MMPYIDETKAKQIVSIAKDYVGTTFLSNVSKSVNGCGSPDWNSLLCFYEVYRVAGHNIDDLINDPTYQKVIVQLLSKIALTPNYSLATCNSNVIVTNGGCGCQGGSSTTGPVSGCTDNILPFNMAFGQTSLSNAILIGVDILIVVREGVIMRANPAAIDGFLFDEATGTFTPNSPIAEGGEDFIILYKNCNSGGVPVPPIGLRTGMALFSGDGFKTDFAIPHGITEWVPSYFDVGAGSVAAQGWTHLALSDDSIIVYYDVAPPVGSNNITLTWAAR